MTFKRCVSYTNSWKTFRLIYAYPYKIQTHLFVYYSLFYMWKNLTDIHKK